MRAWLHRPTRRHAAGLLCSRAFAPRHLWGPASSDAADAPAPRTPQQARAAADGSTDENRCVPTPGCARWHSGRLRTRQRAATLPPLAALAVGWRAGARAQQRTCGRRTRTRARRCSAWACRRSSSSCCGRCRRGCSCPARKGLRPQGSRWQGRHQAWVGRAPLARTPPAAQPLRQQGQHWRSRRHMRAATHARAAPRQSH